MSRTATSRSRPAPMPAATRPEGHPALVRHPTARALTTHHPAIRIAIGATTAAAVVAVVASHRADPVVAALLSIALLSYGVLSAIDAAEQRLPNRITLPLAAATTLAVLTGGLVRSNLESALGALGIGLAFAVALLVMRFGMGDVKLALTVGTIAGWFGQNAVVTTALIGAMSGATVALLLIVIHRRWDVTFSFGPFLAVGSVAGMLVAGS